MKTSLQNGKNHTPAVNISWATLIAFLLSGVLALALTHAAVAQQTCTVPGSWTEVAGGIITIQPNLTGVIQLPYCTSPHNLTISLVGTTGFNVTAIYTGGNECQGFTESLTFGATCSAVSGTFVNDDRSSGVDSWTGANPTITLSRQNLTTVQANGTPSGGTFSYPTTPISGGNFATVDNPLPMSNPNTISLQGSAGNGAPTPGGLEMITAQYNVINSTASDPFRVPTFGMSCYIIALESDYGAPPNNCTATRIFGTQYSGTVLNPGGLAGTYCASFIANLRLQGSAQLNNGQSVQYQVTTGNIVAVSTINGADGTPVVAGQTVARDRAIIPGRRVLVDVDQVGTGLLANDTGGRIRGYRLDFFNGAGRAACASFANPISVAACQPAQPACPGSALQ